MQLQQERVRIRLSSFYASRDQYNSFVYSDSSHLAKVLVFCLPNALFSTLLSAPWGAGGEGGGEADQQELHMRLIPSSCWVESARGKLCVGRKSEANQSLKPGSRLCLLASGEAAKAGCIPQCVCGGSQLLSDSPLCIAL